jgi:hypothetical protein
MHPPVTRVAAIGECMIELSPGEVIGQLGR